MPDPRVTKLAEVLVHYSLDLKPGEELFIDTSTLANPLTLAVMKEALLAGAHISSHLVIPGEEALFHQCASEAQLDHTPSIQDFVFEHFDAYLSIGAPHNTRALTNVDPTRVSRARKARMTAVQKLFERTARHEARWCYTVFPTDALAQDAEMSLTEYEDFVYGSEWLDTPDPVAAWKAEAARQRKLIAWLNGREQAVLKGKDIDLTFSIKGRSFVESAGRVNFPSGEIFTSPVETSANGWVRFAYPAIFGGQEVQGVELWFEDGKVVKERADKGEALLSATLDTDEGSRYLGEWGIGTNYGIQRFTRNILFDEKIGGTMHLALGLGFEEAGGVNKSGIHWDLICDMSESAVMVDGELFYKDGKFAVGE